MYVCVYFTFTFAPEVSLFPDACRCVISPPDNLPLILSLINTIDRREWFSNSNSFAQSREASIIHLIRDNVIIKPQ